MSKMQKIAAVFLVVAVAAWILEKMEIFAVPGLTAIALCVAMCVEGADLLKGTGKKKNTSRRLAAVLVLALEVLRREEILQLPKGEKLAKFLYKS